MQKQAVKSVTKSTIAAFSIGAAIYWFGGLTFLVFYILFLVSFIFGVTRELEKKVRVSK